MPNLSIPNPEYFWLYRLKQSGLFEPDSPQGELLGSLPHHDPLSCDECRYGPCDWLCRQLELAIAAPIDHKTPVS